MFLGRLLDFSLGLGIGMGNDTSVQERQIAAIRNEIASARKKRECIQRGAAESVKLAGYIAGLNFALLVVHKGGQS